METQGQTVTPTAVGLRFGVLLALSWIVVDFLVRIANLSFLVFGVVSVSIALLVAVVFLVLAHKAFRQANGQLMSYGQGMVIAIIMLLISGLASGVFNYVFLTYIDPEFVDSMKDGMTKFMESNNIPDDQIAKGTAKLDEMRKGFGSSVLTGVTNGLVSGLVLGLIVSAFTKRNASEFE
ncbi:DUF4199 domain-containing protein [Hymenobacter caeli]|uniref:DUF4199 domain-containing protein n=1 Tax=Hymenobacter caeli TaxID=2735894 RepID=A0ABX2FWP6_9BACT|nr:DUF4199 domain-containing protein [Hymenobacter caeli]NRT21446.1 hypothetical protein [Hymenobacter caeli]